MEIWTLAAVLALTASCGGDDAEPESAGSPAPAASAPTASEQRAAGNTNVLIGTIGTPQDPFELSLTDSSGEPVTELPAGEYGIRVSDPSEIHNFHLLKGADAEETTTVPETGEVTWTVELTAGDHTAGLAQRGPLVRQLALGAHQHDVAVESAFPQREGCGRTGQARPDDDHAGGRAHPGTSRARTPSVSCAR